MKDKMTKYKFGVMSTKYSLKSPSLVVAKMAMMSFFEQNLPIAIYEPEEQCFMPSDFLNSKPEINPEDLQKAYDSIKECHK